MALQPQTRIQNGVVFGLSRHDNAASAIRSRHLLPIDALDGQIVALGAA